MSSLILDDFGIGVPDTATRALLRALPSTGVFIVDRELRVVLCEGGAFRAAGWELEDIEGRLLSDVLPDWSWSQLEPYYAKALEGEAQAFRLSEPGGATYKVIASPIVSPENGLVEGALVVTVDATLDADAEQRVREAEALTRLREQALRYSEERFGLVFHQAPVGMAMVDLAEGHEGEILELNAAFAELVGRPIDQLPGSNVFADLTHPEDAERDYGILEQLISGAVDHYVTDKRYMHPDGKLRIARLRVGAIHGDGGRPRYAVGIAMDMTERVVAEEAREVILESVFEAIVATDADGRITVFNRAAEKMFGHPREAVLGQPVLDIVAPPELRERLEARLEAVWAADPDSTYAEGKAGRLLRADGTRFPAAISVRRTARDRAQLTAFFRDLTDERRAERRRKGAEDLFRSLFESSAVAMAVITLEGRCLEANPQMCAFLGRTQAELRRCTVADVTHPEDYVAMGDLAARLDEHGSLRGEKRFMRPDGQVVWGLVHTTLLRDEQGRARGAQTQIVDITAQRQANARLGAVLESLAEGVFAIDGEGRVEKVNPAAQRMLGYAEEELVGQHMHDAVHDHTGPVESCPIVTVAGTGESVRVEDDTFRRADGTLLPVSYSAAPLGTGDERGVIVVFSDISERKAREQGLRRRLAALDRLEETRCALRDNRMVVYSQPILDIATGEVVQEELLLRMRGTDGELIGPAEFLPVAEEHGLIADIDRWVIGEAAGLAAQGRHVEVNVSGRTLGHRDLPEWVEQALEASGADPHLLTFEITETALTNDLEQARCFAERVAKLGCNFALDDFGTGYGSFTLLKHLPISFLKIDMEFVRDMVTDAADRHVVAAVVSLAKGLGQRTIAEGVEDEATLALLAEMGVDYAQGYLIGRPAPIDEGPAAWAGTPS